MEKIQDSESEFFNTSNFRTVSGIDKLNFQVNVSFGDYTKFYNKNLFFENNLLLDNELEFISSNKQYHIFKLHIPDTFRASARYGTPPDYFGFIKFKNLNTMDNLEPISIEINSIILQLYTTDQIKEFIQEKLSNYGLDYIYDKISRLDLNIYLLGYDLSFIDISQFSTNSKKSQVFEYDRILETFTIGARTSNTIFLRIYDKWKELKNVDENNTNTKLLKRDLLIKKFQDLGVPNPEEFPLWNIEFEVKREKLKQYSIDNLTNASRCANSLFQDLMKRTRLLNKSTIKEEVHRERIENHKIWDYLTQSYSYYNFNPEHVTYLKAKKYKKDEYYLLNRLNDVLEHLRHDYDSLPFETLVKETKEKLLKLIETKEKKLLHDFPNKENV